MCFREVSHCPGGAKGAVRAGAEPRCLFRDEGFPARHGCSTTPVAAIKMRIEVGRENERP